MERQQRFPPKGWSTRKVFIAVIVVLGFGMLAASLAGPMFAVSETDPRPWAALISGVTYLAMIAVIAWLVWMIFRPSRARTRQDPGARRDP